MLTCSKFNFTCFKLSFTRFKLNFPLSFTSFNSNEKGVVRKMVVKVETINAHCKNTADDLITNITPIIFPRHGKYKYLPYYNILLELS